ncbi:MAG: extracellular solute-binding protein [Lachnospiraceae bacterium]|nr:extracellular solute-binding protein [Lachnospiraceae bacterium]
MRKKWIACLLSAAMAVSVLSGCAAGTAAQAGGSDAAAAGTESAGVSSDMDFSGEDPQLEKHMKISTIWAEDNDNGVLINKVCQDYQDNVNPNFTWEYEYIPSEDLTTKIKTLAGSNDLPDVFAYESGKPIVELIEADKIVDIGAELARIGSTDFVTPSATSLLETLSDTDTIYDLPLGLNVEGFWYNKALFEQAGVEVPETMDEFEAVLKTLYDQGIQPLVAGGASGETWGSTRVVNAITVRTVGNDAMKKAADGDAKYTDQGYVDAAQKVADWAAAGYFGEGINTVTMNAAGQMLMNGQAAIFYNGSWFAGNLNSEDNKAGEDGIGFFNIPVADPSISDITSYSMNCGNILCFDKAKYDDASAWFMKYFVEHIGDVAMETEGTVKGYTYKTLASDMSGYTKLVLDKINKAQSAFTWYEATMDTEVSRTAQENVQFLLTGDMNGEEYMASIQEVADDQD